jgi:hypothetical protein
MMETPTGNADQAGRHVHHRSRVELRIAVQRSRALEAGHRRPSLAQPVDFERGEIDIAGPQIGDSNTLM